jgi:hypothetical protein
MALGSAAHMAKTSAQKHIEIAVKHLESAATLLEQRGFTAQSDVLDETASRIEDLVEDQLAGL